MKVTCRKTAGNLMQAEALWQLRRDLAVKMFKASKSAYKKETGRPAKGQALNRMRKAADAEAEAMIEARRVAAQREYKADIKEAHQQYATPETQQVGGGYATGGEVRGRRGDRARNRRPQRSRENQLASADGILGEFVPGVGEAMDASDAYDAAQRGDYLGAAGIGATGLLGLIPGVGDAAATAARTARRSGLLEDVVQGGKKVGTRSTDPNTGVVTETFDDPADSAWNFSGKPKDEFRKDVKDSSRRAKDPDIDELDRWAGIATKDDIRVANEIAAAMADPKKGNYAPQDIINGILDKADMSKMTHKGLITVLADKIGRTPEEVAHWLT